jgi:hypothetical protein
LFHTQATKTKRTETKFNEEILNLLDAHDALYCRKEKSPIIFSAVCTASDTDPKKVKEEVIARIIKTPLDGMPEHMMPKHIDCEKQYDLMYPNGTHEIAKALRADEYVKPGPWIVHLAHVLNVVIITCDTKLGMRKVWYSKDQIETNVSDLNLVVLAVNAQLYMHMS